LTERGQDAFPTPGISSQKTREKVYLEERGGETIMKEGEKIRRNSVRAKRCEGCGQATTRKLN